jgi:hypothetical protein
MDDEMPGFFPGRPGGEHDEPLLDMILERRPLPPRAPPEMHDLARMLAAVAGPAEPEELAGEAVTLAAFTRLTPPPGTSPAAPRSARRWLSGRPPRGRLPLAAALVVAAAGLGSTAAAYANVLPGPIQHLAHIMIAAPESKHPAAPQKVALGSPLQSSRPRAGSPASHKARPHKQAQAPGNHGPSPWQVYESRHAGHRRAVNPACTPEPVASPSGSKPTKTPSASASGSTKTPAAKASAPTVSPTPVAPTDACPTRISPADRSGALIPAAAAAQPGS